MATGTVILPLLAAVADATNPPGLSFSTGRPYWAFADAADEVLYFTLRVPADYASAPVLKFQWSGSASTTATETVTWACQVMNMTPDVDGAMDSDAYDTANTVDDDILGTTAKRLQEASMALTNDGSNGVLAAEDYIALKVFRDGDGGNDDLTEDAWLWALSLEYTTS
jgi:hypothetical protein